MSTDMSISSDYIFIAAKLLQTHRASGVELLRGDANLAAQAELTAVGESGAGIDINSGAVHQSDKPTDGIFFLGQDAVTVLGGVG